MTKRNTVRIIFNFNALLILFACAGHMQAQEIVFEQDVPNQKEEQEDGPYNGSQSFTNYGYGVVMPFDQEDSMSVKYGDHIRFGVLSLWNINNHLSAGFNLDFGYSGYNVKQDSAKNLYSPGFEHDKQRLNVFRLDVSPMVRIMYGKRGNDIGKYLDLGGYSGVTFGYSEFLRNKVDADQNHGADLNQTTLSRLKYMNRLEYGAHVQFGFDVFTVWAKYRASDMFKADDSINMGRQLPDFPRLTVGVGFTVWSKD